MAEWFRRRWFIGCSATRLLRPFGAAKRAANLFVSAPSIARHGRTVGRPLQAVGRNHRPCDAGAGLVDALFPGLAAVRRAGERGGNGDGKDGREHGVAPPVRADAVHCRDPLRYLLPAFVRVLTGR